ncbi:hypothetical protein B0T17DRAFT_539366 [Bombardia bombarda]|uniref:Calcofluor white hypersensitive protein n=1 Tax=Bombardia bombarda TaxID=252184 RepID=A0AA39WI56_9PEZI|nr:hypothetical protein B0T17DRAFT_539366 [Bombardia bombarda]
MAAAGRSRLPLLFGAGAAGGIGYYLYSAGGSPKVAKHQIESDAHKASAKIKEELPPYRSAQAEKEGQKIGQDVGAKFDSAVNTVNNTVSKDISKAKSEAEAAKADALKKIEQIDRKVEDSAAKSKSYLSSWFGGK